MAVFGRFLSLNFELSTTFFLPATVPRSIAGRRAAPLHLLLRNAAALQKWLRDSPGLTRKKAQTVLGKLDMTSPESLPNGRILLERMALSPERLKSGSRAAVSLTILKAILSIAASKIPFDPEFYLATYPDIREAHKSGRITDLVSHFVETGYFEGRMGSMPAFDEQFYMKTYPDIATALSKGEIKSALDHYIQSGACEGRHASAFDMKVNDHWSELIRNA